MKMNKYYDVVVAGAGTAGSIAAIASARTGARTLVVEQYGCLGGILATGMTLLGAADAEGYMALGGIGDELFARLIESKAGTKTSVDSLFGSIKTHDPEIAKLTLMEMARDAGVNFLLHSFVTDVLMDNDKLTGVVVANKGGLEAIAAKCCVDCTGDADITARANGAFTFGRESDCLTQPVTSIFRVGGVDFERIWRYLEDNPDELSVPDSFTGTAHTVDYLRNTAGAHFDSFKKLVQLARKNGDLDIPRDGVGISTLPERNEVTVNMTRISGVRGTDPDDTSYAEIELQQQILQSIRFLRDYVPGFEKARIISIPFQVGIRESRHIKGDYTLCKDDILQGRDFYDQIGRGAYPLDVHDVKSGTEVMGREVEGKGITLIKLSRSYGIPARCLIPQGVENVVVGGRSISATHEAAGSVRGQAACMVTGHAAGVLAALAALEQQPARQVSTAQLQSVLESQHAILSRSRRISDYGS